MTQLSLGAQVKKLEQELLEAKRIMIRDQLVPEEDWEMNLQRDGNRRRVHGLEQQVSRVRSLIASSEEVQDDRLVAVFVARFMPPRRILEELRQDFSMLDQLDWRQFEELLAELLLKDGFQVTLGPGTKDGGYDLLAVRDFGALGSISTLWQAKKRQPPRRVGIATIRELADVRQSQGASKAIICNHQPADEGRARPDL